MCFDFCNDETMETQTTWSAPPQTNEFATTQVIGSGGGGGLGETTIIQSSYGVGGFGSDTGGLGASTSWQPSQPDGFVSHQEIGGGMGGMGSAIMSQPSFGGGGGLGAATMSTPSDTIFVQSQTMGMSGGGDGQLGQSTYSQNAY